MGDFRSFKTARRLPAEADGAGRRSGRLVARRAQGRVELELQHHRARCGRSCGRHRGRAPRKAFAIVDVRRENFPLQHFGEVLADVRRELMDGRGIVMMQNFPLDRFDREDTAIAYIGLGSYLGQHHVAEQARPHPRPREGPRRRLRRSSHARLHDPRRDALPYRRLRLCGAAVPANVEERRREPHRQLGDGLQSHARAPARSGEGAHRGFLSLAQRRGEPRRSAVFQAADLLLHRRLFQRHRRRRRRSTRRRSCRACRNSRRLQKEAVEVYRADRRGDARSTSTSSAATSSSSTTS